MRVELTPEQARDVTLTYIRENKNDFEAMCEIQMAVFSGLHFVTWSWSDLLRKSITFCSKLYHVERDTLRDALLKSLR